MLRSMLLLVVTIYTLSAPELDKVADYHRSLLGDAAPLFDQAGNVLPSKYTSYIARQKYLILYFASNTCVHCQKFNPELIAWYNANGGGKNFEVILVGKDIDADDPKAWMKEKGMPWLGLEKKEKGDKGASLYDKIKEKYGCMYAPTLVLLDENDEVVARTNEGEKYLGPKVVFKKYLELTKLPKGK